MPIRCMAAALAVFSLFSCQRSAPQIDELQWRLLYRDTGENRYEELAIFVLASDRDGSEDLEQLTVSAGDTGFIWSFNSDEWAKDFGGVREEEYSWIGLPAIIPLEGFSLPEELYTLTLEDRTGESHRITFRPDPNRPRLAEIEWPEARIGRGILSLEGPYDEGTLIFRNEDLSFNQAFEATNGIMIGEHSNAHWWEVWIPLPERASGFRLGPYLLQTEEGETPP